MYNAYCNLRGCEPSSSARPIRFSASIRFLRRLEFSNCSTESMRRSLRSRRLSAVMR